MIRIESGRWSTIHVPKKASTAFSQHSLVDLVDGFATPSSSSSGAADTKVLGVYDGPAISSGSTTTDLIQVRIPVGAGVIRADVTGTIAATDVGDSFDMSTSLVVNGDSSTNDAVVMTKYISSSVALFSIEKPVFTA